MSVIPEVTVDSDYDGYFERFVAGLLVNKEEYNFRKIIISAGPYRSYTVSWESKGDVLHLDFYSAMRNGFAYLDDEEIKQLTALL